MGKDKKRKREDAETARQPIETPQTAQEPTPPAEEAPQSKEQQRPAVNDELEPEAEALSRKEKRKRRKLEAAGLAPTGDKADGDAAATKEATTTTPAKGQTPAKQAHGVWIGNLNFKTSSKELIDWLAARGIAEVTRINMPAGKKAHENNRGFAYVDFASEPEMQIAIAASEQNLDGRKLLIKASTDYTGRPATAANGAASEAVAAAAPAHTLSKSQRKILNQQKNSPAPCLFFGNLGFETTQDDIKQMIENHHAAAALWRPKTARKTDGNAEPSEKADVPEDKKEQLASDDDDDHVEQPSLPPKSTAGIRKVRLGTFEDTGKCKGWAFVDFHTTEQATAVLINTRNHTLNGRTLVVEYASADAVRRGGLGTRSAVRQKRQERAQNDSEGRADGDEATVNKKRKKVGMSDDAVKRNAMTYAAARSDEGTASEARPKPFKNTQTSRSAVRAKPGAALASAARASQAIVESRGKKTVF